MIDNLVSEIPRIQSQRVERACECALLTISRCHSAKKIEIEQHLRAKLRGVERYARDHRARRRFPGRRR